MAQRGAMVQCTRLSIEDWGYKMECIEERALFQGYEYSEILMRCIVWLTACYIFWSFKANIIHFKVWGMIFNKMLILSSHSQVCDNNCAPEDGYPI